MIMKSIIINEFCDGKAALAGRRMHQVIIFFAVVAGRDDAPAVFAVERQRLFILHRAFQRAGGGEGGFRRLQQRTAGAARR